MLLFLKKIGRFSIKILLGFLGFVVFYLVVSFVLSRITVNSEDVDAASDVSIFIKSNGVHTDIVLPLKNEIKDWTSLLQWKHTKSKDSVFQYVAIGWGDRDFYLNTPTWSDLKVTTALKAALHLGNSAMHTQFYATISESEKCKKIEISSAEYRKLVDFISESFRVNESGNFSPILNAHYNANDAFYEANGTYDLFTTCNSWTNSALKVAKQRAAVWALTDNDILRHYAN